VLQLLLRLVDPQQRQHLAGPDKAGRLQDAHEIPLVLRQIHHMSSPRFWWVAGPVQIRVHQDVAVGLADGVENHCHGVGGGVPHIPLITPQLALHALEDYGVQVPQAGAHVGQGQDGFPDSEAVRIKQPLDGVGKYLCRLRLEDSQLAVVQNPG